MEVKNLVLQPGESLPYQVSSGDKVQLRNDTTDVMVLSVKGKASGTVVRAQLPPGGEIQVTTRLESIDITLGDVEQRPPVAVTH